MATLTSDTKQETILVVDDNLLNLDLLLSALHDANYTTLIAESGEDALHQAEAVHPDLILLDILMPGLDGFETCRRLKQNPATKDIPVIFMTALVDIVDKVKGFEVGGVDYITKPFHLKEVLARVNAQLTIRRQQQEILRQNHQLKDLNACKDKFFSIIAHDLKSPLAGLLVIAQLIQEKIEQWEKGDIGRIADQLQKSVENLHDLVENLLTWASIQQGNIHFHRQRVDLKTIILRNIGLLTLTAKQKQITLTSTIHPLEPLHGDVNMIDTVVRNLLSNALKFTQPGGNVEISAEGTEKDILVKVMDTGIGMQLENLSKLFRIEAKYQRIGTAGEKGTGLGLILCRDFIAKHGGAIWIDSEIDKGTTVSFTLPLGD